MDVNEKQKLEKEIHRFYENQPKLQDYDNKNDWFEEDERSTSYVFHLEKTNGQNKLWQIIKGSDLQFKYDINSILDDQIKFQRGGTKLVIIRKNI
jgi:hypothetical protein